MYSDLSINGSLEPEEYSVPRCPHCYAECETFYLNKRGEVIGCDECVTEKDAWEVDLDV